MSVVLVFNCLQFLCPRFSFIICFIDDKSSSKNLFIDDELDASFITCHEHLYYVSKRLVTANI
jgi:hypothetical protein